VTTVGPGRPPRRLAVPDRQAPAPGAADARTRPCCPAGDDKFVGVATPSIIQQLLNDGQLDAIHVNLVPLLLGAGVPFFANLADAPVRLSDPEVVESKDVTHLTYTVLK
jgi:hypothetical protein